MDLVMKTILTKEFVRLVPDGCPAKRQPVRRRKRNGMGIRGAVPRFSFIPFEQPDQDAIA